MMNARVQDNRVENNAVILVGEVVRKPEYTHKVLGTKFYIFDLSVPRTSGTIDKIPVMVSDKMCYIEDIQNGDLIKVKGQFRSYNKRDEKRSRLILSVFAFEISNLEEDLNGVNDIEMKGYICKEPTYRITPNGREISDLLIATNRAYGNSDYIPCIAWGSNAKYVAKLPIGTHIKLQGRIQSREYEKKNLKDEIEIKIAYEVSISRIGLGE